MDLLNHETSAAERTAHEEPLAAAATRSEAKNRRRQSIAELRSQGSEILKELMAAESRIVQLHKHVKVLEAAIAAVSSEPTNDSMGVWSNEAHPPGGPATLSGSGSFRGSVGRSHRHGSDDASSGDSSTPGTGILSLGLTSGSNSLSSPTSPPYPLHGSSAGAGGVGGSSSGSGAPAAAAAAARTSAGGAGSASRSSAALAAARRTASARDSHSPAAESNDTAASSSSGDSGGSGGTSSTGPSLRLISTSSSDNVSEEDSRSNGTGSSEGGMGMSVSASMRIGPGAGSSGSNTSDDVGASPPSDGTDRDRDGEGEGEGEGDGLRIPAPGRERSSGSGGGGASSTASASATVGVSGAGTLATSRRSSRRRLSQPLPAADQDAPDLLGGSQGAALSEVAAEDAGRSRAALKRRRSVEDSPAAVASSITGLSGEAGAGSSGVSGSGRASKRVRVNSVSLFDHSHTAGSVGAASVPSFLMLPGSGSHAASSSSAASLTGVGFNPSSGNATSSGGASLFVRAHTTDGRSLVYDRSSRSIYLDRMRLSDDDVSAMMEVGLLPEWIAQELATLLPASSFSLQGFPYLPPAVSAPTGGSKHRSSGLHGLGLSGDAWSSAAAAAPSSHRGSALAAAAAAAAAAAPSSSLSLSLAANGGAGVDMDGDGIDGDGGEGGEGEGGAAGGGAGAGEEAEGDDDDMGRPSLGDSVGVVADPGDGGRKGKLESWERVRVDDFVAAVQAGTVTVARGELASRMRHYVNTSRAQMFYEKLISRRKLNTLLLPFLVGRPRKVAAVPGVPGSARSVLPMPLPVLPHLPLPFMLPGAVAAGVGSAANLSVLQLQVLQQQQAAAAAAAAAAAPQHASSLLPLQYILQSATELASGAASDAGAPAPAPASGVGAGTRSRSAASSSAGSAAAAAPAPAPAPAAAVGRMPLRRAADASGASQAAAPAVPAAPAPAAAPTEAES